MTWTACTRSATALPRCETARRAPRVRWRRCSRPSTPGSKPISTGSAADWRGRRGWRRPRGRPRRGAAQGRTGAMETRANYVLIGAFTLAVVAAAFGFVYWFSNLGDHGVRDTYRVVFDGTVSGLRTGSTVLFNGMRAGEVTELKLNPTNARQVVATIAVEPKTPIRADTTVSLDFQGLTGSASVFVL